MFLDASAIVAMLTDEPEREVFLAKVAAADDPLTSAIAIFETTLALARRKGFEPRQAEEAVTRFLQQAGVRLVDIGPEEQRLAVEAHALFGKGRHPAGLNMGDCFAYACARSSGRRLLFKGDDFVRTDIDGA